MTRTNTIDSIPTIYPPAGTAAEAVCIIDVHYRPSRQCHCIRDAACSGPLFEEGEYA